MHCPIAQRKCTLMPLIDIVQIGYRNRIYQSSGYSIILLSNGSPNGLVNKKTAGILMALKCAHKIIALIVTNLANNIVDGLIIFYFAVCATLQI